MVKSVDPSGKESIANIQNAQTHKTPSKLSTTTESPNNTADVKNKMPTDQLDLGKPAEKSASYAKPTTVKPDMKRIEELKKEAEQALQPLRDMVKELLRQQGIAFKESGIEATDETLIDIPPEMKEEAQRMIADDGEYGVDKTSTRLVEFAKAISGGDKSQVETLRKAIQDGYDEAEKAFGGTLPDISKQTLEMTMKKLDEWASSEEPEIK